MIGTKPRQTVYAVVESADALDLALKHGNGTSDVVVSTTSPYVVEVCATREIPVHRLDGEITQEMADAVGYACIDATAAIARRLDTAQGDDNAPLGWALIYGLQRAMSSYMYKAFLLGRLVEKAGADGAEIVLVGSVEDEPVQGFRVIADRFDTLYSVIGNKMGITNIPFVAKRPSGAMETGDFMRPTIWTRLTTLMNAPMTSIAFRLGRRLGRRREISLNPFSRRGPIVALNQSNELMEEVFLALLSRGKSVRFLNLRIKGGQTPPDVDPSVPDVVVSEMRDAWSRRDLPCDEAFLKASRHLAERAAQAIGFGASISGEIERQLLAFVQNEVGDRQFCLLNAMNGPYERLIRHFCTKHGIGALVVEHGVAPGLSPLHEAFCSMDTDAGLQGMLLYTPAQRELFRRLTSNETVSTCAVAGVPHIVRGIRMRWLQRILQRTALGVKGRVTVWCTGLYPNNFQFLPHYWRDTHYHEIRKQVVYGALAHAKGNALLKLYPTFRYTDPDPLADLLDLPKNCTIQQFTDFRNMRAAADVLIVDGPGSILSWAWSAGVPLIYLETGMYVVSDTFADALRDGAFFVDCREEGWLEQLQGLLTLEQHELEKLYREKAEKRRETENFFLFGSATGRFAKINRFVEQGFSQREKTSVGGPPGGPGRRVA